MCVWVYRIIILQQQQNEEGMISPFSIDCLPQLALIFYSINLSLKYKYVNCLVRSLSPSKLMTWYFWVLDCCCCNQHPTSSWWQQCPDSIWHQSRGEMCVFVKDPIFHTVPINNKGNTNDIEGHKCCCYTKKGTKNIYTWWWSWWSGNLLIIDCCVPKKFLFLLTA